MTTGTTTAMTSDDWTRLDPMTGWPPLAHGSAGTAIDGHRFFVAGGGVDSSESDSGKYESLSSCGYYDTKTKIWNRLPDLPFSVVYCEAVCIHETLYVLGGGSRDFNARSKIYSMSLSSDNISDDASRQWDTSLPRMNQERTSFACASHSNAIYVFGGLNTERMLKSVEKFDTKTKRWTPLPNMPEIRYGSAAGVVGNKIYVVGGHTDDDSRPSLASTVVFDTSQQQWISSIKNDATIPPVPNMKSKRYLLSVVAVDNFVVAIGGIDARYNPISTIEILDTRLNVWRNATSCMKCRRMMTAAGYLSETGEIIIAGGYNRKANSTNDVVYGEIIHFERRLLPATASQTHSSGGRNDETKNTNDQLGYDTYADVLVNVVETIEGSGGANFAVGLMASWGVGKTKLWYLIKDKIKKADNVHHPDEIQHGTRARMPKTFATLYLRLKRLCCFEENQVVCKEQCDTIAAFVVTLSALPFLYPVICIFTQQVEKEYSSLAEERKIVRTIHSIVAVDPEAIMRCRIRMPGGSTCLTYFYAIPIGLLWLIYYLAVLAVLAVGCAVVFVVPFLFLLLYIIVTNQMAQNGEVVREEAVKEDEAAREVWNRIHGDNLSPIMVLTRASAFTIPILLRVFILMVYWIIVNAVHLCVNFMWYISVFFFGQWLAKPFKPPSPLSIRHKKHIFVDFNAWVYNGSDDLWASLMLTILAAVEKEYPSNAYRWYKLECELAKNSIDSNDDASTEKEKRKQAFRNFCVQLSIFFILSLCLLALGSHFLWSGMSTTQSTSRTTSAAVSFVTGFLLLSKVIFQIAFIFLSNFCVNPIEQLLKAAINASGTHDHDFSTNAGFMGEVKKEMELLSSFLQTELVIHMGNYRKPHLSISIDDLDRCDSKTIVRVLRAVCLMLEGEGEITIWLAIDPQIVVSAIDDDIGDILRKAGVDGVDFLDKIIQLPFCIPSMSKTRKDKLMARMSIPNSPSLKSVEVSFGEFKRRIDKFDMRNASNFLEREEIETLQRFKEMHSNWNGSFSNTEELKSTLKNLGSLDEEDDDELCSIALERVRHLESLESKYSIAMKCFEQIEPLDDAADVISNSSNAPIPENGGMTIPDTESITIGNEAASTSNIPAIVEQEATIESQDADEQGMTDIPLVSDVESTTTSLGFFVPNKAIMTPDEWLWIRSISKHFPKKPRKTKRIFNVYNVSRQIFEKSELSLKGKDDCIFRRKMIKAIVLAEMWPRKMAWILQVAENALATENLKMKHKTVEGETDLNALVRKTYALMGGDPSNKIELIFKHVPLGVVYSVIVAPLMHSVSKTNIMSGQEADPEAFHHLLEEYDETLHDQLTLSDVHPVDYANSFDLTMPSLRPFMFNMQEYYLDKATFDISKIIICCNTDPVDLTDLNVKCKRKSDCYVLSPRSCIDTGGQIMGTTPKS